MNGKIILNSIDWVVMTPPEGREGPGADILCLRCGRRDAVPTPLPISAMPYFTRAMQEFHRYCPKPEARS